MHKRINKLVKYLKSKNFYKESDYIESILKTADSVGSMINILGYPKEIAKALQELFGKNSFLIAKWLKESNVRDDKYEESDFWINRLGRGGNSYSEGSVIQTVKTLKVIRTLDTEAFKKRQEEIENWYDEDILDEDFLRELEPIYMEEIKKQIKEDIMFWNPLMKDVISGKLTNLAPYKKLDIKSAIEKYEEKRIFNDIPPIKEYPNGFKWINVGRESPLIGKIMRNCGSVGAMSWDVEASMIVLFNKENSPKVLATYSENQNLLTGIQGKASTDSKDIYDSYVLDLANEIGANIDTSRSISKSLSSRYELKDVIRNSEVLNISDTKEYLIYFEDINGRTFYTNGRNVIKKEDIDKVLLDIKNLTDNERSLLFIGKDYSDIDLISWIFSYGFNSNYKGWKPEVVWIKNFVKQYEEGVA